MYTQVSQNNRAAQVTVDVIIYLNIDIAALAIFLHATPVRINSPRLLVALSSHQSVRQSSCHLDIECVVR